MHLCKTPFWFILAPAISLVLATGAMAQTLVNGIDVSNHQTTGINWTSVKNAGYLFAFAKATEGVDFNDASFQTNMTNAANARVYIGPYHFARVDSNIANPNDAVDEANDFVDRILQVVPTYHTAPGYYLRPVVDIERLPYADTAANRAANKAYTSEWVRDFAGVVQSRLGVTPIIYSNTYYAQTFFETNLNQFPFWLANYNYTPPTLPPSSADGIFNGWDFWQYSSTGPVSGVPGSNVDKDVYQGMLEELLAEFLMVQPHGDFNSDGTVDGSDFLNWQRNTGKTGGAASFSVGDANGDRAINATDLAIWQSGFGATTVASAAHPAPEPAGALLAVFTAGLSFAATRAQARRRRPPPTDASTATGDPS